MNRTIKVTGYKLETFSESEKLKMELQSFGFYYSKHPIIYYEKHLSSKIQPINRLVTTSNEKYILLLLITKELSKRNYVFVFLEISDETGLIDVSVPVELHDEKKPLFKENSVVMIKGKVVTDDYRRGNLEDVGIKVRATDVMPIEVARKTVTSRIRLDVSRKQLKELGNGKFDDAKALMILMELM